ncbi:MAG: Flp family type IVb pilin [Rhodobacterales bacterium]|jgi:pilus assembly protein Flp/PilA|nr:Flp family type IVb pilin [Rhodobacterales bacterium]
MMDFLADDGGATAIEYALIAGLIAIAIVGGAASVGSSANDAYQKAADGFPDPA